jgi:hypothetical protein
MNCDLGIVRSWSQNLIGQGPEESEKDMKKLMIAAAAALCATVGLSNSVESANVVGYMTTAIEGNKWYLIGTQFKGVGKATDEIPINNLCSITGVEPATFATKNTGLQIQVYNGVGYTIYSYISDATGATGPCWTNSRRPLADTVTIPLGTAFWLKTPATVSEGASITVAGAVKTDATSVTVTVGENEWTQVANPFPTDLTISMITTEGLTPATFATKNSGPQIQVYNGVGYTIYSYISDATGATGPCWTNTRRPLADSSVIAQAGKGFWVKSASSGTLTISLNK